MNTILMASVAMTISLLGTSPLAAAPKEYFVSSEKGNDTAVGSGITITLTNESGSVRTSAQIVTPDSKNVIVQPQQGYWLEYKASNNSAHGGWTIESYLSM